MQKVKNRVSSRMMKFIGIALTLLLVFFLVPQPAHAGCNPINPLSFSLTDCVTGLFQIIAYVFSFIGGILFALANYITQFVLNLNFQVMSKDNSIVQIGWSIVRDVANLGFVLVIIVIAFVTILRIGEEQYGVKKLLPKLIAAAILVNFSLTIAGVIINFSDTVTYYFMQRVDASGNVMRFTQQLANAFGPQKFFLGDENPPPPNPEEEVGALASFGVAVLSSITSLIFVVVFTFIAAFVMLTLAFMLLMRYLWLTFLLILSPLIWLFWVIPVLQPKFSQWWNKFLQWVFFAPAVSFFMFLSLVSLEFIGKQKATLTTVAGSFFGIASVLQPVMVQGAQMIIIAGIMIGGIMVAQSMGITGADAALGAAKKFKEGFIGKPGALKRFAEKAGEKTAAGVATVPGLRRVVGIASSRVREKVREREAKGVEEEGGDIAEKVRSGKMNLDEVRAKAGSNWKTALGSTFARRKRNQHMYALATLESGTVFDKETGKPNPKKPLGKFTVGAKTTREVPTGLVGPDGKPVMRIETVSQPQEVEATKADVEKIARINKFLKKTGRARKEKQKKDAERSFKTLLELAGLAEEEKKEEKKET